MKNIKKSTAQTNPSQPVQKDEVKLFFIITGGIFAVMLFAALISGVNLIQDFGMIGIMFAVASLIGLGLTRPSSGNYKHEEHKPIFDSDKVTTCKSVSTSSRYHYVSGNVFNNNR